MFGRSNVILEDKRCEWWMRCERKENIMKNEQESMETEVLRNEIFKSYLYTKCVVFYWGRLSYRYYVKELVVKIFLVASTFAVVGGWKFGGQTPMFWKGFSGVSAVIAFVHLVINWQKSMSDASGLGKEFGPVVSRYKILWMNAQSEVCSDELKLGYKELMAEVDEIERKYPEKFLKFDEKLLDTCMDRAEANI